MIQNGIPKMILKVNINAEMIELRQNYLNNTSNNDTEMIHHTFRIKIYSNKTFFSKTYFMLKNLSVKIPTIGLEESCFSKFEEKNRILAS